MSAWDEAVAEYQDDLMESVGTFVGVAGCPCCEGSGQVPSASGMTDVDCLCQTLDANDRVILRGRADTLAWWESQSPSATLTAQIERLWSSMVHLVAGCVGPCRGNSARADQVRCLL